MALSLRPRSSSTKDTDSGYGTGENTPEIGCKRLWTSPKLKQFDIPIQNVYFERFEELQEVLGKPLADHVLHSCTTCSAISMKIMCLGRSEPEAKPWIVVQCDPKIVRSVRKFFAQKDVKDQLQPLSQDSALPNFGVIVHGVPPVQLAAISMLQYKSQKTQKHSLCGARIRLDMGSESDSQVHSHVASIGGLVCISVAGQHKFYATTVEHIVPARSKQNSEEQRSNCDSDVDTEVVANSQTDIMEDESFELQTESGDVFASTNSDRDSDTDNAIRPLDMLGGTERTTEDDVEWTKLGNLHRGHTMLEANLDWAAIEIANPALLLPNAPSILLELKDEHQELRTYFPTAKLERRKAIVLEEDGRSRVGEMSMAPSFLLLPSGTSMTKTYVLKLDSKNALQKGDCGKWVVDPRSCEVFGHIVGVDTFGEAFVMPMHEILDQMRRYFGADDVRLAERTEIERYSIGLRSLKEGPPTRYIHRCWTPQASCTNSSFDDSAYASGSADSSPGPPLESQTFSQQTTVIPLCDSEAHYDESPNLKPWKLRQRMFTVDDSTDQNAQTSSTVAINAMEGLHEEEQLEDHPTSPFISLHEAMSAKARRRRLGCENLIEELGNRDIIFLIDNSASMEAHWHAVSATLETLAYSLKASDPDGMDMCFTNSDNVVRSQSSSGLVHALPSHVASSTLTILHRLSELLLEYRHKLAIRNDKTTKSLGWPRFIRSIFAEKRQFVKPLSIYILTDARNAMKESLDALLTDTVKDLSRLGHTRRTLGIEFIRFGDDIDGKKQLDALQNLHKRYSLPFNIVDTTHVTENFVKMLVGAIWGVSGKAEGA